MSEKILTITNAELTALCIFSDSEGTKSVDYEAGYVFANTLAGLLEKGLIVEGEESFEVTELGEEIIDLKREAFSWPTSPEISGRRKEDLN